MLPRVPAWYTAMLGAIRIGAVVMPAPNMLTPRDIGYRIGTSGAVAAITDASGAERLDAVTEPLDSLRLKIAWGGGGEGWEDLDAMLDAAGDGETPAEPTQATDPMVIFFTSGTVSYPKMVQQPCTYGLGHVDHGALLARPAAGRPALDGV